jgi:hypothetical protein
MRKTLEKQNKKCEMLKNTKTHHIHQNYVRYPRVLNQQSTQFTDDEIQLWQKGMKHSQHQNWIKPLP